MSDLKIIKEIINITDQKINFKIKNDICYELYCCSEKNTFSGSLRPLTPSKRYKALLSISKLKHLEILDLSHNNITELPIDFSKLKNLKSLNISSNYLNNCNFLNEEFTALKHLNIGSNLFESIPTSVFTLSNLEELKLYKNTKIKNFTDLRNLKKLKLLNLYFLNLIKLPECFFELQDLETLAISNTYKFTNTLQVFTKLKYLTLCGTRGLKEIPDGLTELKNLKMLRLFQNSISLTKEQDFSNLQNIEQISLYQNQISIIPESIKCLNKLKKLNFGWNNLKEIPEFLFNLPELEWLGLFQNPLNTIYNHTLKKSNGIVVYKRPFTSS
jgi:Leucine-rich repeat (LRR) protein